MLRLSFDFEIEVDVEVNFNLRLSFYLRMMRPCRLQISESAGLRVFPDVEIRLRV